jgi:hypothetical protein
LPLQLPNQETYAQNQTAEQLPFHSPASICQLCSNDACAAFQKS